MGNMNWQWEIRKGDDELLEGGRQGRDGLQLGPASLLMHLCPFTCEAWVLFGRGSSWIRQGCGRCVEHIGVAVGPGGALCSALPPIHCIALHNAAAALPAAEARCCGATARQRT